MTIKEFVEELKKLQRYDPVYDSEDGIGSAWMDRYSDGNYIMYDDLTDLIKRVES